MKSKALWISLFFQCFSSNVCFYSRLTNLLTLARNATEKYFYDRHRNSDLEQIEAQEIYIGDYDFIIVGSGSSGSVIANRLSENSNFKVLLLEAGKKANAFTQIPILAPVFQLTGYNWNYTMEKMDTFCLAMEDQKCAYPRGKALGGSTVINYMIYTRGNPHDFQQWSQEASNWTYDDVLPYYLKSENCQLGDECQSQYHNEGGYMTTEKPYFSELSDTFLEAASELGHKIVDYNTPEFMGFSIMQSTLKKGRRVSVFNAFLEPIHNRTNLQIVTSSRASKILINEQTLEAYGIEFYKRNKKYTATITKEVILSAGAFHSPQLLMVSGIGPRKMLKENSIKVLKNLPVGKTMYDHISFLGFIVKINKTVESRHNIFDINVILDYIFKGENTLTSLGGIESIGYINTLNNKSFPDIELIFSGIGTLEFDRGLFSRPELRITREFYDQYYKPLEKENTFAILPMLLHPKSKGYLKIDSNSIFHAPKLYGNYLTDEHGDDLNTLIRSIRFMQKLINTKAFQKYNATLYDTKTPGCESIEFDTDAYWECTIRHTGVTLHHQISTCKMGHDGDKNAVVDNTGKVYGVRKLRVADSSIIPVTLSGHTNAPSIMIGEKISDDIKRDYS